jgi:hypothetical protein
VCVCVRVCVCVCVCVCKHGCKWVYACVWHLLQARARALEALEAESAADDALLQRVVAENVLLHQALRAGTLGRLFACMYMCMCVYSCRYGGRDMSCLVSSLLAGEENSKNLASVPERLAAGQRWHTMLSVCAELPGAPPRCPHDAVDVIYNDERWFSHKEDACVTPRQWNACIASLSGDENEGIMKCWDRIFAAATAATPTSCFGLVRHDVLWTLVATSDEHPLVKQREPILGDISEFSEISLEGYLPGPGHHGPRLSVSGGLGNLNGIISVQKLVQKAYSYARSSQKSTYKGRR